MIGALLATACTDRGPAAIDGADFDARRVEANLQMFDQVLGSAVWQSFRALGPRFTVGGSAVGVFSTPSMSELALQLIAAAEPGVARVPRLPSEIRGTTLVLDPETLRYVPDPERSGAPENGVRFILYPVNPVTQQPVLDAEIGYADLIDEGEELPDGIALRLEVVSGDVAYLDYRVSAGGTETSGSLTAAGFITDGQAKRTLSTPGSM